MFRFLPSSPLQIFLAKPFSGTSLFLPRSIHEPANFCHEASANQPIQVKRTMVSMSSKALKVAPKMVGAGLANAATGSGMSGGKRLSSLSPPKLRISSNLDGRRSILSRKVGNKPEVAARATGALDQPPTLGKKTRSVSKAANEASEPANTPGDRSGRGGRIPKSPVGRSGKLRATSPIRTRDQRWANSDESVNSYESGRDVSKKCKEAGGAQDSIFLTASNDEENDEEDDEAKEVDDELTLLQEEMAILEHQMYATGTVALVFARTTTQSRLTKKTHGAEVLAAMEDIFQGNENPDPGAVTKALQPDTASARAYLAVVNLEVGFTLLHYLQRMDQEIWPGDTITNRIVAFEGDIRPQGFPSVVGFNEAEDTLFQRFNLPPARLLIRPRFDA